MKRRPYDGKPAWQIWAAFQRPLRLVKSRVFALWIDRSSGLARKPAGVSRVDPRGTS